MVLLLLLSTVFPLCAAAQDASRQSSRINADSFVDRLIDGQRVTFGYGNVLIDRDSLVARCDTAISYRDRSLYEFYGHVHIVQNEADLTCRRGLYRLEGGEGDFFGDVRVQEEGVVGTGATGESRLEGRRLRLMGEALLVTPEYSVRADTIFRDRLTGEGEAFGHVKIMQPEARNLVTGDHAFFRADGQVAEVDRNPVFVSREQKGGPLTSTAGRMRFHRNEDLVVMTDSVRIHTGQTRARADTAFAYGRERLRLYGSPSVRMGDENTMLGNEIEFQYSEGELRRVVLIGDARMEDASPDSLAAIYRGLPELDVLEGDSITVFFRDEKVHRSVVVGNAHSIYTPMDLEGEVATNDVVGDTIVIHFRNERVNRVDVVGTMAGNYRFAKIADMEEVRDRSRRLADVLARSREDSLAVTDSLGVEIPLPAAAPDSTLLAALDSLAAAGFDTSRTGLDFTGNAEDVKYSGDTLIFEMGDKKIDIAGQGELIYGTMKLTAGHIKLDTQDRELYAEDQPLVEDSDVIAGELMGYNFRHKTGAVESGVTNFDEYYYVGDEIRRFPDTTLKICSGKMTSCDREEPHYHFWSDKMKIRMGDKVVAAPIVLRIGRVPVFALPFYFRNLKEGRRSGILFPSFDFGWSSREGRYIRDFGYYWATNDYTDFIFEGDYNEHQDLGFRISNRYVSRYSFRGGVDYSRRIGLGSTKTREWQLRWNHDQPTLLDDYRFRADVKMASTTLSSNDLTGSATRDIVSGQLKSNVYVSRNWSFVSTSVNASRDERVNEEDDDPATDNFIYSQTLPSVSLNFRQWNLAPPLRGGQRGSLLGDLARATYFSQGYTFRADTRGYEVTKQKDYKANGNWSLSVRPPRVSIFNFSLTSSASQAWTRTENMGQVWVAPTDSTDGYYEDLDEWEERTNPALSFGSSVGTTLYGLFPVRVGPLRALRHTVRLNTGWSVRPALGSKQKHSTSVSLSMNNRVDAKYVAADSDTTQAERKLDGLIDWDLSTSYNPKREPGERWSDISSGLAVKPGQSRYLNLKVNNVIDPKKLALKSTRFSYGVSFGGRLDVGEVAAVQEERKSASIERLGVDPAVAGRDTMSGEGEFETEEYFPEEDGSFDDYYRKQGRGQESRQSDRTEGGRYIPFDFNSSISYSYTNASGSKRASGNLSLKTNLTQNWEARYTASYDLVDGTVLRQQFSLNRDLHCWRLEFNRTVSTLDSQFGFRLYLKSIPALKLTRGREDGMGSLGAGVGGF